MNNKRDQIYDSIKFKELLFIFLISGMIGIGIFAACFGVKVLDVTYDAWMFNGQDLNQHYIGWKFYRQSPWHFPLGMIDGLVDPQQSCIIFTDSIPLFAIFFKLLSPVLPETFQYFGLFGVFSYFMMGGISAVILRKFTDNRWLCITASAFFSYSPYLLQRMYVHTSLAGQWVILMAVLIWVYKPYFSTFKKKLTAWGITLIIASLVHIYFIPMVLMIFFGSCVQDLIDEKSWKENLGIGFLIVLADLLVLYSVGAFTATSSFGDGGLGMFSSNLNVFFNPSGKSRFIKTLAMNPGQDEGFGYLGLGMLVLALIACCILIRDIIVLLRKKDSVDVQKKDNKSFFICIVLVIVIALVLALSPVVTLGHTVLLDIHYPELIVKLLSVFRASGRFIWCADYLIMICVIGFIISRKKYVLSLVAVACTLALQFADFSSFAKFRWTTVNEVKNESLLQSPEWEELAENKEHIVFLPYNYVEISYGAPAVYEFAEYAVQNKLTVNYYVAARVDLAVVQQNNEQAYKELAEGNGLENTIYILDSQETGTRLGMDVFSLDGFWVGIYK